MVFYHISKSSTLSRIFLPVQVFASVRYPPLGMPACLCKVFSIIKLDKMTKNCYLSSIPVCLILHTVLCSYSTWNSLAYWVLYPCGASSSLLVAAFRMNTVPVNTEKHHKISLIEFLGMAWRISKKTNVILQFRQLKLLLYYDFRWLQSVRAKSCQSYEPSLILW